MAKPKYDARFVNFFLNLRLNRDQFADMAAFTLQAVRADAKYKTVADPLDASLTLYRTAHIGQLSGEGAATVLTLGQALLDFKAYVKRVERKFIIPNYAEKSADVKALLPHSRSGLVKSSQAAVEDAFTTFLDAMDARLTVFPSPVRTEGRKVLQNLADALKRADQQAKTTDDQRLDLHDGREATCLDLFRIYGTLLLEFADEPKRAAAFFDLSNAGRKGGGPKTPPAAKP